MARSVQSFQFFGQGVGALNTSSPPSTSQGITIITVDNSTKKLPPPSSNEAAVAIHTSSNSATIEDPNGNDIIWPGRANSTSIDLYEKQSIFLSSDGVQWYVENPPTYEASSFAPGTLINGKVVFRHRAQHDLYVDTMDIDVVSAPSSDHTFEVDVDSGATVTTINLPGGNNVNASSSIDAPLPKDGILLVTSKSDTDIKDVTIAFDLYRD